MSFYMCFSSLRLFEQRNVTFFLCYIWDQVAVYRKSFYIITAEKSTKTGSFVWLTVEHLVVNEDQKRRANRTTHARWGRQCEELHRLQSCRHRALQMVFTHMYNQLTSVILLAAAAAQSISGSDLHRRNKIKFMLENCKLIHPEGNNLKCRESATVKAKWKDSRKVQKTGSRGAQGLISEDIRCLSF